MPKIEIKILGEGFVKDSITPDKGTLTIKFTAMSDGSLIKKIRYTIFSQDGDSHATLEEKDIFVPKPVNDADCEIMYACCSGKSIEYLVLIEVITESGDSRSIQKSYKFKYGKVKGEISRITIADAEIVQDKGSSYLRAKITAESKDSPLNKVEVEVWDSENSGFSGRYAYESIPVDSDIFETPYEFKFHQPSLHNKLIELSVVPYTKGGASKKLKALLKMGKRVTEKYPNEPQPGANPA
jgi:hypothetical protein